MSVGCASKGPLKFYKGETKPQEQLALIKGHSEKVESFLIDLERGVVIKTVDGRLTTNIFSNPPKSVLLEPSRHYLGIRYYFDNQSAYGVLWLDAEPGKTYIVKFEAKGYHVRFWFEDEATGEIVGGIPGSEPEKK